MIRWNRSCRSKRPTPSLVTTVSPRRTVTPFRLSLAWLMIKQEYTTGLYYAVGPPRAQVRETNNAARSAEPAQSQKESPMPAQGCHPHAAHKKLRIPDWYVSSLMLDRALDAILRRVMKLDRTHDVPYLAGYSQDGQTIYIDRHLPPTMNYKGRKIEVDRYLIMHEEVEKTLIDQLGLHYLHAHQIATRAEEAAVRADGIL